MKNQLILSIALYSILSVTSIASTSTNGFKTVENSTKKTNIIFKLADDTGEVNNIAESNPDIIKSNSHKIVETHRYHSDFRINKADKYVQVSSKNHKYLQLSDGTPYIPVGLNICWPRFETDEEKVMVWMENDFRKLAENGGNYIRIWLSAPFYELEYKNAYEYDFTKARRIDRILEHASKYGIKVKFCFENFRELTNSPAPFPGSVPFDKPIYHVSNGGPLNTMDEYFGSDKGKNLFLKKLEFFSNRYAHNPNVYAWELWNEINAANTSDSLISSWTREMLIKGHEYFPNHLVIQSLGGFENERDIKVYKEYSLFKNNDIAQVHRYLNPGAGLEVCKGPMDILAADAVRQIISYNTEKPVILAEVGAVEAHHAGPSKLYDVDKQGVLLHDLLFAPFFSGAAAPGHSWHWDFYIEKNNLWWHFGRFNEAIKGINPITEDFQPLFTEDSNLRNYILKGKNTVLIWCRDKVSDWQSELVEGKKAEKLSNLTIDVSKMDIAANAAVEFYLPWENKWQKGKLEEKKVSLPEFTRSLVIRITKK